jgi:small subunit ribosomal protein S4
MEQKTTEKSHDNKQGDNRRNDQRERREVKKRPGQHGASRRKKTEYGIQLANKQDIRLFFGLRDKKLKIYFEKSKSKKGNILDNLCDFLCSRLDSVLVATGVCPTVNSARQLISHKHVLVNGKLVNKRSYPLSANDEVSFQETVKNFTACHNNLQKRKADHIQYLVAENLEHISGAKIKMVSQPTFANAIMTNKEKLKAVIEYYSK